MAEFTGNPAGSSRRIAVVASRFNETVTRALVDGAMDALVRHGVAFDDVDVIWVPGAWELPLAVRRALNVRLDTQSRLSVTPAEFERIRAMLDRLHSGNQDR